MEKRRILKTTKLQSSPQSSHQNSSLFNPARVFWTPENLSRNGKSSNFPPAKSKKIRDKVSRRILEIRRPRDLAPF
jgi:hypothetical protein